MAILKQIMRLPRALAERSVKGRGQAIAVVEAPCPAGQSSTIATRCGAAACALLLDWRTWHRPVGAKDAAAALLWLHAHAAPVAFIEVKAGIGRHCLSGLMRTLGTGDDGLEFDHSLNPCCRNYRDPSIGCIFIDATVRHRINGAICGHYRCKSAQPRRDEHKTYATRGDQEAKASLVVRCALSRVNADS
jgi:hypothetical protein